MDILRHDWKKCVKGKFTLYSTRKRTFDLCNIVRPSQQQLSSCFNHWANTFPARAVYQTLSHRLSFKKLLRHLPISSIILTVWKVRFSLEFWRQSPLMCCSFDTKQHLKYKETSVAPMIVLYPAWIRYSSVHSIQTTVSLGPPSPKIDRVKFVESLINRLSIARFCWNLTDWCTMDPRRPRNC